jgi:peptidoglycan/LPS O-acetylase OafA/YrhL
VALHGGAHLQWEKPAAALPRALQWLSAHSYGIFVCHYAAILLVSGLWIRWSAQGLGAALAASAMVLTLSFATAALMARTERQLQSLARRFGHFTGVSGTRH